MSTALVLMDYQNIHLTAHEAFVPARTPKHESLVHPLHFANQVLATGAQALSMRGLTTDDGLLLDVELGQVSVHRGLPSNRYNSTAYRRSMAQKAEWTRDPRVSVQYRPLRYYWDNGERKAQEKGVDVLVALELVRLVRQGEFALVVLASHDTDLEPALEEAKAQANSECRIETAGWQGCKRLKPSDWHTFLPGACLVRSRDRKDYT